MSTFVVSRQKICRRQCLVLELVPLRGEKISMHAHKTGSWYLFGVLYKISDEQPRLFYMGVPPGLVHDFCSLGRVCMFFFDRLFILVLNLSHRLLSARESSLLFIRQFFGKANVDHFITL